VGVPAADGPSDGPSPLIRPSIVPSHVRGIDDRGRVCGPSNASTGVPVSCGTDHDLLDRGHRCRTSDLLVRSGSAERVVRVPRDRRVPRPQQRLIRRIDDLGCRRQALARSARRPARTSPAVARCGFHCAFGCWTLGCVVGVSAGGLRRIPAVSRGQRVRDRECPSGVRPVLAGQGAIGLRERRRVRRGVPVGRACSVGALDPVRAGMRLRGAPAFSRCATTADGAHRRFARAVENLQLPIPALGCAVLRAVVGSPGTTTSHRLCSLLLDHARRVLVLVVSSGR
jgi:hypothetical protein